MKASESKWFGKRVTVPLIIMILVFLLCLWALYQVADLVFEDKNSDFDAGLTKKVHGFVSPAMTAFMQIVTFLGSQSFLLPASILLIGYFLFYEKNKRTALIITAISISSVAVLYSLKDILHRARPEMPLIARTHGYSFPSGHSFTSVTFYGMLAYIIYKQVPRPFLKWLLIFLLFLFTLLIGISRMYLQLHYPSDVIAGFSLGVMWLLLGKLLFQSKWFAKDHPA